MEHHVRADRPGHHALRHGRVSLPQHAYLLTAVTLERIRWFVDFDGACAASRCFDASELLGNARMLAWVLMPDHAHWLLQLGDTDRLDHVANRLKSASARAANHALGRTGSIWARAYHDRALRDDDDLRAVARYIIANPLRARLVEHVGEYPFWNAMWL